MTTHSALSDYRADARDREPIQVEFASDPMGIAAALRRAFTAAATDRSDHDFEDLLARLN